MARQPAVRDVTTIPCFVLGGRGLAAHARASEIERLNELMGITLIRGSLNLISLQPVFLNTDEALLVLGEHAYWRAEVNGLPVILNRWRGCPAHVYEVFANVHLRSTLSLQDTSMVVLTIRHEQVDAARTRSVGNLLVWYALWRWRERFFYAGERYLGLMRHRFLRRYTRRAFQ